MNKKLSAAINNDMENDVCLNSAMDKITLKSNDIKAKLKFKYFVYKIKRSFDQNKFFLF